MSNRRKIKKGRRRLRQAQEPHQAPIFEGVADALVEGRDDRLERVTGVLSELGRLEQIAHLSRRPAEANELSRLASRVAETAVPFL